MNTPHTNLGNQDAGLTALAGDIVDRIESLLLDAEATTRPLELDPYRGKLFELFVTAHAAGLLVEGGRGRSDCRRHQWSPGLPLEPGRCCPGFGVTAGEVADEVTGTDADAVVVLADVDGVGLRLGSVAGVPRQLGRFGQCVSPGTDQLLGCCGDRES